MAFQINKILKIRQGPFSKNLDLTILEKVEELIRAQKGPITLFSVKYQEKKHYKGAELGFRYFHIIEAYNQRDK